MQFRVSKVRYIFRTEEIAFDGTPEECSKLLTFLSMKEEIKAVIESVVK